MERGTVVEFLQAFDTEIGELHAHERDLAMLQSEDDLTALAAAIEPGAQPECWSGRTRGLRLSRAPSSPKSGDFRGARLARQAEEPPTGAVASLNTETSGKTVSRAPNRRSAPNLSAPNARTSKMRAASRVRTARMAPGVARAPTLRIPTHIAGYGACRTVPEAAVMCA
jgi:hypothetical protein